MKIKTSELIGAALDWAVAKCEGASLQFGLTGDERYSTDWSQGGPIIEREDIAITPAAQYEGWFAHKMWSDKGDYVGSTPLAAAMRCFVAFKLGDEVDVPDEIVKGT